MKVLFLFLIPYLVLQASVKIIDRPIIFDEKRISLSKQYIKEHYGLHVEDIKITPRIIVIHWTATNSFDCSLQRFNKPLLPSDRPLIKEASPLNVSAHFMVDRNGTIYRLMDEKRMARHVIGLNYCSIGIENVGGENDIDDLTPAQLTANIELIRYLQKKYPDIEYLIGHHEYTEFVRHPLWLEKDDDYRTLKYDPGDDFMIRLRKHFPALKAPAKEKL